MKSKNAFILSIAVTVLCLASLFVFKGSSNSTVWKGYRVLSVPVKYSEKQVLEELRKQGFDKVISKSSRRLPFDSEFTPVFPKNYNDYSDKIDGYFFDASKKYRIYYLENPFDKAKLKKLPFYKDTVIDSGTVSSNIFFYVVVFCFLCLVVLMKKRIKYALALLPFLCFSFSNTGFASLIACVFSFTSFYFIEKTDSRKNHYSVSVKNPFVIIGFAVSSITLIANSIGLFVLYLVALTCSASIFTLYELSKKKKLERENNADEKHFEFVRIATADFYPVFRRKTVALFYCLCAVILASFVFYFFPTQSGKTSGILIPTPQKNYGSISLSNYERIQSKRNSSMLADFSDYINQEWVSKTYSFVSMNEKIKTDRIESGKKVSYTDYVEVPVEMEDGLTYKAKIVPVETIVAEFNPKFIRDATSYVAKSDLPTIEKLLLNQKNFYTVDYSGWHKNVFEALFNVLISLIFCVFDILLFSMGKSKKFIKVYK